MRGEGSSLPELSSALASGADGFSEHRGISLRIISESEFSRLKDLRTHFMERVADKGKVLEP
jgi:hypothetical protein